MAKLSGADRKLSRDGARAPQLSVEEPSGKDNTQKHDTPLTRRAFEPEANEFWHLSHISWPENRQFDKDDGDHQPDSNQFLYSSDDSWGKGQTIYIMESTYDDDVLVRGFPFLLVALILKLVSILLLL